MMTRMSRGLQVGLVGLFGVLISGCMDDTGIAANGGDGGPTATKTMTVTKTTEVTSTQTVTTTLPGTETATTTPTGTGT